MRTIVVTIDKRTKKTTVEPHGFGARCGEVSANIQAALGETISDTPTAELYEEPLTSTLEIKQ